MFSRSLMFRAAGTAAAAGGAAGGSTTSGTTGNSGGGASSFRHQLIDLKKKYRGGNLYKQAQDAARELFNDIPKNPTEAGWLTEDNATAAMNGIGFFEIFDLPQKSAIVEWSRVNILEFKSTKNMILATIGLLQVATTPEQREKEIQFIKENVIPRLRVELVSMMQEDFESTVKLFHRAKIEDEAVWADVCSQVVLREEAINQDVVGAVRLFTVLARFAPTNPVTVTLSTKILGTLGQLKPYDFASFVSAIEKLQLHGVGESAEFLPQLLDRLSLGAFSARDLAIAFASLVRMFNAFVAKSPDQALALLGTLQSCFNRIKHRAKRHMHVDDPLFWNQPRDVISIAFAYESLSRTAHGDLFDELKTYISTPSILQSLSPHDLAMVVGILRRTNRLDGDILAKLGPAVESVVSRFADEELAHVALGVKFCGLKAPSVDVEVAKRTPQAVHAKANFMVAYGLKTHEVDLNSPDVTSRQLIDLLILTATGNHDSHGQIEAALLTRLATTPPPLPILDVDLHYVEERIRQGQLKVSAELASALEKYVLQRLAGEWNYVTFDLLHVVPAESVAQYEEKAVEYAGKAVTAASLFIHVIETLLAVFPNSEKVKQYIAKGSVDLINEGPRELPSILQYLEIVLKTVKEGEKALLPSAAWFDHFIYHILSPKFQSTSYATLELVTTAVSKLEGRPLPRGFGEAFGLIAERLVFMRTRAEKSVEEVIEVLQTIAQFECGARLQRALEKLAADDTLTTAEKKKVEEVMKELGVEVQPAAAEPAVPAATPKPAATPAAAAPATPPSDAAPEKPAFVSKFAKSAKKTEPEPEPTPAPAKKAAPAKAEPAAKKAAPASKAKAAPAKKKEAPAKKAAAPAKKPAPKKVAAKKPAPKKGKK